MQYLTIDTKTDTASFVFPQGTDRDQVIETLEYYCKSKKIPKYLVYEFIGSVLADYCFGQVFDNLADSYTHPAMTDIFVSW